MKKGIIVILVAFILTFSSLNATAMEIASLDTRHIESGILSVQYNTSNLPATKIMIENGTERKFYNLHADRTEESFPLSLGNGEYTISFLEHISGNQYRPFKTELLQVDIKNESGIYLSSVQEIRWDEDMAAIQKAAELTDGMTSDLEKTIAVYEYIVQNISYDYDKIALLTSSYLPDINSIFAENKGICYDYASLFAAMLRSVGVQARMAKGYAPGVTEYHAWNEVFVGGQWRTLDTTMDAAYWQAGRSVDMFKETAKFNKTSEV